jgi:hypothetical protein
MDGRRMDLTVVSRALQQQTTLYKWIWGIEVHPDVTSRRFTAVLLDTEGNEGRASVMLEARWCRRSGSSSWLTLLSWLWVSGASGIRYLLGSVTLALTSAPTSLVAYTQPFGSDVGRNAESFGDDSRELLSVVIGWQNCSGILVVLVETVDEASCQRRGLHTTEVKSRHTIGRNGS